MKETAVN